MSKWIKQLFCKHDWKYDDDWKIRPECPKCDKKEDWGMVPLPITDVSQLPALKARLGSLPPPHVIESGQTFVIIFIAFCVLYLIITVILMASGKIPIV